MNKKKISRILGVGVTLALLSSLLVGALPVSGAVTSASVILTHATPALADDISQPGVVYTTTFTISANINQAVGADYIQITMPTGTGNLAGITAAVSANSGIGTDAFTAVPFAVTNPTGTTLRLAVPAAGVGGMNGQGAIGSGALVQVVLSGVTNAPTPGTYSLMISTSGAGDTTAVASQTFTLNEVVLPGTPGTAYGYNSGGYLVTQATGDNAISTVMGVAGVVKIVVGAGTYDEQALLTLNPSGIPLEGLEVVSQSGAAVTVISDVRAPLGLGGNVSLTGGLVTTPVIFDGFTVTGGVTCDSDYTRVRNCILSGNPALSVPAATGTSTAGRPTSTGNTINPTTAGTGLMVNAGEFLTSTGDTFSSATGRTAVNNAGTLTLSSATVTGASGTGLTNSGTTTVTGSTFSTLTIGINATGGTTTVTSSTLDACGTATPPARGAIYVTGAATIARVLNSTVTNSPDAIGMVAAGANGSNSYFKFCTLTGNVKSFTSAGGGVLDATNNWWGTNAGPTVASTAALTLTTPWLIAPVTNAATPVVGPGALALNGGTANIPSAAGVNVAIAGAGATLIAAANYATNPAAAVPPADTVKFFEVYIADATTTDVATLTFFGITNPLAQIYAYSGNQSVYVLCSNQRVDMFQGAVIVTVNGTTVGGAPTSPNLGNMSGLEFVLTEPAVAPLGAPAQNSLVPAVATEDVDVSLAAFTWGAVAGATGYEFEMAEYLAGGENPFIPAFLLLEENPDTNGVVLLADLDYLTVYSWRVRAIRGTEEGAWVTSFFTTAAEVPEDVSDVWIIEQEPTQIEWPDNITIEVPPIEQQEIPEYILWVIVAVGAILVIAVIVLIVRTRRVA